MKLEVLKVVAAFLSPLVTLVGFYFIYQQIVLARQGAENTQKWKQNELLANEVKTLFEDPQLRDFYRIMDYSGIHISYKKHPEEKAEQLIVYHCFKKPEKEAENGIKVVNLGYALRHHGFKNEGQFSPEEDYIRRIATRYIEYIARLNSFLESKLIEQSDLMNFMRYHLKLTSGHFPHAREFLPGFYEYIVAYDYRSALTFLKRFDVDDAKLTPDVKRYIADAELYASLQSEGKPPLQRFFEQQQECEAKAPN